MRTQEETLGKVQQIHPWEWEHLSWVLNHVWEFLGRMWSWTVDHPNLALDLMVIFTSK